MGTLRVKDGGMSKFSSIHTGLLRQVGIRISDVDRASQRRIVAIAINRHLGYSAPVTWNWIAMLAQYQSQGRPLALVTVTQCTGSTPRDTGAKMIVLKDGEFHGTIGGGHLEELAIRDARACIEANTSKTIRYPLGARTGQCCGGIVELLMEVLNNGPRLFLFGAGHVGRALCRALVGTPFTVHLIDERGLVDVGGDPRGSRAPSGGMAGDFDDTLGVLPWEEKKTFVAIMTHRHDLDQEIVKHMVDKKTAYIGLIGSQRKWESFKQRLTERGTSEEKRRA